jgi:hypothetical protein
MSLRSGHIAGLTRTLLFVAAITAVVGGCSIIGASAPAVIGARPLVTITTRGGDCPGGPCGSSIVIERDGTVRVAAKPPNAVGTVPPELLTALQRLAALGLVEIVVQQVEAVRFAIRQGLGSLAARAGVARLVVRRDATIGNRGVVFHH